MDHVITTEKKPIKLWLEDIEEGALQQAKNLANLPFVFKHISIMPDSHQGYGMPIGAVMATQGVVVPNAVGVDIGCGMCAVKTNLTLMDQESLQALVSDIKKMIPVGFKHQTTDQEEWLSSDQKSTLNECSVIKTEYQNSLKQLGTLGGGNHFIEIQKGSDGFIWLMIHSGSRNLGFKVANHYNKIAIELNEMWHLSVPKEWQLAFLPMNSTACDDYLQEMNHCVEFALKNRELMMERIETCVRDLFGSVKFSPTINIAHNYVAKEHHFGKNVMVHRKGATKAYKHQLGIIPGSQGTSSYIVTGKGERESFKSCSHGAGRKMGRKQAQRELNLEEEQAKLDFIGVIHSIENVKDLDEAPGSYKDISVVMANQEDLVEILVELTPLAVIKG